MRQVTIPGTALSTSRFILGTANLFNGQSSAAAEAFLERAVELGFSHIDTAPLYGFGHAERVLAPVLRRHRQVTVTTKAGLYAPGGESQAWAQVLTRKAVGRLIPTVSRAQADYSVARARASLTASLSRLGRERVELLMVHEPDAALMRTDEWLAWLTSEQRAGRVGAFGVAGTAPRIAAILREAGALAAITQLADSLEDREADLLAAHGRPMQITYGYVSRGGAATSVHERLVAALRRNADGAIIVSTRRIDRLPQYRDALAAADAAGHR